MAMTFDRAAAQESPSVSLTSLLLPSARKEGGVCIGRGGKGPESGHGVRVVAM